MSALLRFPGFKYKAFTLSYDDGSIHDIKLSDTMAAHGVKGTFNINSANIGKPGRLTADQIRTLLLDRGMEVAAHGERHLSLAAVDSAVAMRDVINDRVALEKEFGIIIKGMAYANGSVSDDIATMLRLAGIEHCRTTVPTLSLDIPTDWLRAGATCHHNHPRLMEMAKNLIDLPLRDYYWAKRARLLYVWGHSHEFNNNNDWHIIEELLDYVGGRDDVWYATLSEIYEYTAAYNALRHSADDSMIHNPTATDVYVHHFGKDVLIPAGKTVSLV